MGKRTVAPTIAITVAITILIAIYDCHFGARRAPTIAIAIQILSAAFFCTSLCPFVSCSCFLWLAMLALSASCVTVGSPMKLRRCAKEDQICFCDRSRGWTDRSRGCRCRCLAPCRGFCIAPSLGEEEAEAGSEVQAP